MQDLQNKLVEIITQLQGIVKDNAADALNLGLSAIRISGIQAIIEGIVMLCLGLLGVFAIRHIYKKFSGTYEPGLGFLFVAGCTIFFFVGFLVDIFNVWTYVAIFEPKLWLAHKIIGKLG